MFDVFTVLYCFLYVVAIRLCSFHSRLHDSAQRYIYDFLRMRYLYSDIKLNLCSITTSSVDLHSWYSCTVCDHRSAWKPQHTATHRNTPQHTATYRNITHTATDCNTSQYTATHPSVAVCCGVLRYIAVWVILRYVAVYSDVLRYVAVFRQTLWPRLVWLRWVRWLIENNPFDFRMN
jgi:hypothetical protein